MKMSRRGEKRMRRWEEEERKKGGQGCLFILTPGSRTVKIFTCVLI